MMGFDLLLLVIVGAVVYALGWRPQFPQSEPPQTDQTALEILRERYARGEVTREEYEQVSRDLEGR